MTLRYVCNSRLWLAGWLGAASLVAACSNSGDDGVSRDQFSVLTLNLHTYQEIRSDGIEESELTAELARTRVQDYGPIFDRIAAGINELDPDIICLQEVGEWPADRTNVAFGTDNSNMVRQILARLNVNYDRTMVWSHFGWGTWLEGSAILSRLPITTTASRFISDPSNGRHTFWKSRNVPMAALSVPGVGDVAVYSVHTGWWDDAEEPALAQYDRLFDWIREKPLPTTILCGDFNAPAGGPGYDYLVAKSGLVDQYLLANPMGMFDTTLFSGADGWDDRGSGQRIDYIFVNASSPLRVVRAERVFTQAVFGRVSDHVGVFAVFKTK